MQHFFKMSFYAVFLFSIFCSTVSCAKNAYSKAEGKILQAEEVELDENFAGEGYYSPATLSAHKEYTNKESGKVDIEERKLIKTGNINFESADIKTSRTFIEGLVKKYGAYISNENEDSSKTRLEQNITLKIPKDDFDSFIAELLDAVKHVNSKNIYIQDVTEEFIDIKARLKVKKEAEQTYLRLLESAKTVRDVLDIQDQLQAIRSDIESIEGRLKYLEASVNYSTINIRIYQFIAYDSNFKPASFFLRVASSLKEGVRVFAEVIIWLLNMWVFIAILIVAIIILRVKFRQDRRKK